MSSFFYPSICVSIKHSKPRFIFSFYSNKVSSRSVLSTTHSVCGLTLILQLMSSREKWEGVWVTHFEGLYASNAVKLSAPLFSSHCGPSIILLFNFLYSTLLLWSTALYLFLLRKAASCYSVLTLVYLSSSCTHIGNHLKSLYAIMVINCTVTGQAVGVKLVRMCEHSGRSASLVAAAVSGQ